MTDLLSGVSGPAARRRPSARGLATRALAVAGALTLLLALLPMGSANAATGDYGHRDGTFTTDGTDPTGSKPESKLWYNDGTWWGSLWSDTAKRFRIHRLDPATDSWVDTGVDIDTRSSTRADALSTGAKVYIASHSFSSTPTVGYPARLYRYSYDGPTRTYHLDAGFPVDINNNRSETLVIARDSTGMLWATWTQSGVVYINHTTGADTAWGTPTILPTSGVTADPDDISSIIAFTPSGSSPRIGVMWSNQLDVQDYFAIHVDGAADTAWTLETALSGARMADDHINLKTDASGRVYAVVKTSVTTATAPLIRLLVRSPAGTWTANDVATYADSHTRAIVLLDESAGLLHVFMTGPTPPSTNGQSGGTIYEKTSSVSPISFPTGLGTPVIRDSTSADMNNATSTKQNVDATTGLVVLAGDDATKTYWHTFDPLGGAPPPAPVADFNASPTQGDAPLVVSFSDLSSNGPTAWAWDFGDGATSTTTNPSHQYDSPGTYSVTLTASNLGGSDTVTKTDLITVTQPPPTATVSFTPTADAYVNQGSPNKNYGTAATLRLRSSSSSYHSYLKFAVAGVNGPVTKVRLRLFVTDASTDGGRVSPVDSAWTETGITWNTAPAIAGSPLASIGPTTTGTWVDVDLGTAALTADGTYAFGLANTVSNSAYYSSRQGTNPPQLLVTYATSPPVTPVADFTGTPTSGTAPLSVAFTDTSTNTPTSWAWDFDNDGAVDSTARNPTHVYPAAGTYTVALTATNGAGSDTATKVDYVVVDPAPPTQTLVFPAAADARVYQGGPNSNYGSDVALRVRLDATAAYRSYLRFDVSGIVGTVTSATLRLYCTDASPDGGTVYPVANGWTESAITWANAPGIPATSIGATGAVALDTWVAVPVTATVTADGSYSFALSDGNTNSAYYSSREGAHPAELVVVVASP